MSLNSLDYYAHLKLNGKEEEEPHYAGILNKIKQTKPLKSLSIRIEKLPNWFDKAPKISTCSLAPWYSLIIQFPFTQHQPYHSKEERYLSSASNPLLRDKVFGVPMVNASSWKGALRATMVRQLVQSISVLNYEQFVEWRLRLVCLFGNENGVQEDSEDYQGYLDEVGKNHFLDWKDMQSNHESIFFSGRLFFFPTFFEKANYEVINPHDRRSGTGIKGRGPIKLECVPCKEKGYFSLLLMPCRFPGQARRKAISHDLKIIADGIRDLFTTYGFGAKTSSGYGIAEEQLPYPGKLIVKIPPGEACYDSFKLQKPSATVVDQESGMFLIKYQSFQELCQTASEVVSLLREGGQ